MPQFNFYSSISEIGEQKWNTLCGNSYPFLRYGFLNALETSGSVAPETGWQPCHLLVTEADHAIAAMPLYLKSHSYGEYVFDWAWADAYDRNSIEYYPKLVSAIPFTPCYGPRLVFSPDVSHCHRQQLTTQILIAIKQLAHKYKASGWHCLFPENNLFREAGDGELNFRLGTQYHWFNRDYDCFDDFLARFSSRKRKNLNKERQKIEHQQIRHQFFKGDRLTDQQLDAFYRFYHITYLKRGRKGYLTRRFFQQLRDSMPEQLLICFAYDMNNNPDEPVAGALFLEGKNTLYGRYWGAQADYDSLHFETCYYQGIEYCISNRIQRFDPGAQGEHKIQRGFEPIETWSAHWLSHPGFQQAVKSFCLEEEQLLKQEIAYLRQRLPFRKE